MDRFLSKLERRIGWLAIPRFAWFLAGAQTLVFLLALAKGSEILSYLVLDWSAVSRGEVWRLLTFAFLPWGGHPVFVIMGIFFTYWCASNLEAEWGTFKLNLFFFSGLLFTATAGVVLDEFVYPGMGVSGILSGQYLEISLLFAFATLHPDLGASYFFIPMRLKWLAVLIGGYMVYTCVKIGVPAWILAGAAVLNYLLFFSGHLLAFARGQALVTRQAVRRASVKSDPAISAVADRTCAVCGAKQSEGADIRVCSCEKCGGKPRDLCLAHARNH